MRKQPSPGDVYPFAASASQPVSLMRRLKEETAPQHARIERNPVLQALMSLQLSADLYRIVLERLYGFYSAQEAWMAGRGEWARLGFPFEARRKAPLLRRDLMALGLGGEDIDRLTRFSRPAASDTFSDVVGCLYVMEGATLGGQLIARHLRKVLGLDASQGAAFHHSYGAAVGPMWKAYCGMAERCAVTGLVEPDAVVQAARATFDALDRWLLQDARFTQLVRKNGPLRHLASAGRPAQL